MNDYQTSILVLGGGKWADRLNRAVQIINTGNFHQPLLVLSIPKKDVIKFSEYLDEHVNPEIEYVLNINIEAKDTVGDFIVTKEEIELYQTDLLYVVTDKNHINRAMAIARNIYLGSSIYLKAAPCKTPTIKPESKKLLFIDQSRALLWRMTGLNLGGKK